MGISNVVIFELLIQENKIKKKFGGERDILSPEMITSSDLYFTLLYFIFPPLAPPTFHLVQ